MKPRTNVRIFLLGSCCLWLVACGGGANHDDLKQWMREATKNQHGKIPPLPEVKPYQPAVYQAEILPDPFKPGRIESEGKKRRSSGKLQPDFEARELRNNPLERYSLETLNMIGYLKIGSMPYAVVQADQLVKQVKIGEYIGQDFGIVTQISDTEVTVRELIQDSAGDWSERTSTLLLQEKSDKKGGK
jgi:type IV pilus assembly protein PilP